MSNGKNQYINPETIPSGEAFGNVTISLADIEKALANDSRIPGNLLDDIMDYIKDQVVDNGLNIYEFLTNAQPPRWLQDLWPVVSEIIKSLF